MSDSQNDSGNKFLPKRGWIAKFRYAGLGVIQGVRGQSSFLVHIPVAIAVVVLAFVLKVERIELCVLLLCIALVLTLELVNSALERISSAVVDDFNKDIEVALNASAGAVLVATLFSIVLGLAVFLPRIPWSQ